MAYTDLEKENIYRDYYQKVLGFLYNKTSDRTLAEDLASDVFLKVYEKLDTFDSTKASLSTWIFTITRNTLTDHFRTRRVFEEVPEELDDGSDVEDEVCNAQMLELLAKALEKLDEREQDIIIQHFYHGKTLREIADAMDISYAYVKVLQNKAFSALRGLLG